MIYAFIIRTVVLDGNATAVVQSRLGNELSKLYKMSSIQNKIMLKILWLCFLWTRCIFFRINLST